MPVRILGEFRDDALDDWSELVTDLGGEILNLVNRGPVLAAGNPVTDLVGHFVENCAEPARHAVPLGRAIDGGRFGEETGVVVPLRFAK